MYMNYYPNNMTQYPPNYPMLPPPHPVPVMLPPGFKKKEGCNCGKRY